MTVMGLDKSVIITLSGRNLWSKCSRLNYIPVNPAGLIGLADVRWKSMTACNLHLSYACGLALIFWNGVKSWRNLG